MLGQPASMQPGTVPSNTVFTPTQHRLPSPPRLHATAQAARAASWPCAEAPAGPEALAWTPPTPLHMHARERGGGAARPVPLRE